MKEELQHKIDALLKGNSDDFKVIEFGIDFNVVQAYLRLMASIKEKLSPEILAEKVEQIDDLSMDEQKELLAQLARSGSVASYRALETFMEKQEGEMRKWAVVALQHCRMHVENDLLDEPIGFIATGLGGKGLKIRYYFILESKEPLRKVILDEVIYQYNNIAPTYNAEIEEFEQLEDYVLVKILCPINVQLGDLIEEGLDNLPFLVDNFVATNVMRPTLEKIKEWMTKREDSDTIDDDKSILN